MAHVKEFYSCCNCVNIDGDGYCHKKDCSNYPNNLRTSMYKEKESHLEVNNRVFYAARMIDYNRNSFSFSEFHFNFYESDIKYLSEVEVFSDTIVDISNHEDVILFHGAHASIFELFSTPQDCRNYILSKLDKILHCSNEQIKEAEETLDRVRDKYKPLISAVIDKTVEVNKSKYNLYLENENGLLKDKFYGEN